MRKQKSYSDIQRAEKAYLFNMAWLVCTVIGTFALSLTLSTFTKLATPWWILAICACFVSFFVANSPRIYAFLCAIAIVISVIVKYGGVR